MRFSLDFCASSCDFSTFSTFSTTSLQNRGPNLIFNFFLLLICEGKATRKVFLTHQQQQQQRVKEREKMFYRQVERRRNLYELRRNERSQ